ncbi:hypothetical protein V8C86DRAFT_1831984 [Haematococcus lacustris]
MWSPLQWRGLFCPTRLRLQAVAGAVRTKQLILIVPFLILTAMLVAGILGVLYGAGRDASASQLAAVSRLEVVASSLSLTFMQASLPVKQAGDLVSHIRDYPTLQRMWHEWIPPWWSWAPPDQSVVMILVPNGIVSAVYPTTNNTITQLGVDIFQGLYRVQTLQTLAAKRMIIAGPYTAPGFDTRFVTISMPLYLSNVSSNESFGIPWQPFDCPPGLCYDSVTHTKWWGSVAITLNVDACLTDANGRPTLQQFSDIGMQYRLTSPAFSDSTTSDIVAESTSTAMSRDSVCRPIHLLDDKWQLCVWKDSWQPPYVVPLLVVIVAVTLLFSVATFMVLLSRHEHRVLLYSLLPKAAIKQLHAHFDWSADMDDDASQGMVDSGTPAEAILGIMEDILLGRAPSIPKVMLIKTTVQQSLDIYNPLRFALSERIRQNPNVDDEVYKAIMLYMGGGEPAVLSASDEQQHHGPVEACGHPSTSPTTSIDFSSCIGALPAAIPEEPSHPAVAYKADPMSADRRRPCRVANKSRMSLTVPPMRDAKLQADESSAESQDETSTSAPLILLMQLCPA